MNLTTRFRFTVRSLEQLTSCPIDRKAVEYSDIDQPGLKLAQSRTSQTFWYRFVYNGKKGAIRLGRYPSLSIQEARQLALAYRESMGSDSIDFQLNDLG